LTTVAEDTSDAVSEITSDGAGETDSETVAENAAGLVSETATAAVPGHCSDGAKAREPTNVISGDADGVDDRFLVAVFVMVRDFLGLEIVRVGVGRGVTVRPNEFEAVNGTVPVCGSVGSKGRSPMQLKTFKSGSCPGLTSMASCSLRSKHSGRKYLKVALLRDMICAAGVPGGHPPAVSKKQFSKRRRSDAFSPRLTMAVVSGCAVLSNVTLTPMTLSGVLVATKPAKRPD
jgi:hypothetical protein